MRLRLPRIVPVELWDLVVDGKLLQEWRDDPTFPTRIATAIAGVRRAAPATWSPRAREAAPAIAHVHACGGGITDAIAADSRTLDPFEAARAGARLAGACADVGQTALKLVDGRNADRMRHLAESTSEVDDDPDASDITDPRVVQRERGLGEVAAHLVGGPPLARDGYPRPDIGRAWRVERDLARAPMRDGVALADRAAARTSTVDWLATTLAGLGHVLVALPCEFDDADRPRSCTYCWPDPDPQLHADLEERSGCTIDLVNDAELAALAALPLLPATAVSLVITIGFAVGGALVLP